MSALNKQVAGNHYKDCKIQPVQYIHANELGYFEGNVVKYITRWKSKGGVADLEKAKHYIELLIELQSSNESNEESKVYLTADDAAGWIRWKGGDCPVLQEKEIEVKLRGINGFDTGKPNSFDWSHSGTDRLGEIIAYRIAKA